MLSYKLNAGTPPLSLLGLRDRLPDLEPPLLLEDHDLEAVKVGEGAPLLARSNLLGPS